MPEPMPNCPECGNPLQKVRNTGGWMNDDQFDAVKAGDWFCECHNNGRGNAPLAYYWNREVSHAE